MIASRLTLLTHLRSTPLSTSCLRYSRVFAPACQTVPTLQAPSSRTQNTRTFASSASSQNWLIPNRRTTFKDPKGRPRMPTGGSTRGTTLIWGDYGLRMRDHDRRISAAQLKNGEDVIRRRLRGMNFRLFMRISAGTAVYTKGNESRMGTGKGSFDYWAARVPVSRIIFEIKADVHEQVIRDAMRLAANKMPGTFPNLRRKDSPLIRNRPVRVCEEGRPASHGYHKAHGSCHSR